MLHFDTTLWRMVFIGGMLRVVRSEVLKTVENGWDVTGHGNGGRTGNVVPFDGQSTVKFS